MAIVEMVMPKMGESVMEGTVLQWLKKVGDLVNQDEMVLEVATDKVDTEIPSTHSGTLIEILAQPGDVVEVGKPIARLETEVFSSTVTENISDGFISNEVEHEIPTPSEPTQFFENVEEIPNLPIVEAIINPIQNDASIINGTGNNGFYSPLVLNIAKEEGITFDELSKINGTGQGGRVTKEDIISYVNQKKNAAPLEHKPSIQEIKAPENIAQTEKAAFFAANKLVEAVKPEPMIAAKHSFNGEFDIQEMDRTRKLIAQRMLDSKNISAHVTSFVEADVTNLVLWRSKMKHEFMQKEGDALTLTPLFIEAIAHALKDFPKMNASVDGDKIIIKKNINIGMAVALPDGNLIVPVIKNADQLNLVGITKKVNELA
ncbi:MAG: 2-oxo acid dehydrogenase subunit E2, partial [Cytophagales bacterium]